MDLLSAKVYLGLLLGTLPLIPPAEGAPPDIPPGDGTGPPGHDSGDPGQDPPGGSRGGVPDDGPPRGRRDGGPRGGRPPDDGPGGSPARDDLPRAGSPPRGGPREGGPPDGNAPDDDPPGSNVPGDDVPPPGNQDAPRYQEDYPWPGDGPASNHGPAGSQRDGPGQDDDDNCWQARGPAPLWPGLPAMIPPALARSAEGGTGPVPASQARRLAAYAAGDPAAEWRIIVSSRRPAWWWRSAGIMCVTQEKTNKLNEPTLLAPSLSYRSLLSCLPARCSSLPAMTSATSRSSRTSTTARPRWSTRCCGSRGHSARTRRLLTGCSTPVTWSGRRASRSWPRTRRSPTAG